MVDVLAAVVAVILAGCPLPSTPLCDPDAEDCGLLGAIPVSQAVSRLDGAAGDHLGDDVARAGDVDGDGILDLLVGAASANPAGLSHGRGATYVYRGGSAPALLAATPSVVVAGEADGGLFGMSISGGHDLNGDGLDDFVATDPLLWPESPSANSGGAYVLLTPIEGLTPADEADGFFQDSREQELSVYCWDEAGHHGPLADRALLRPLLVPDMVGDDRADLLLGPSLRQLGGGYGEALLFAGPASGDLHPDQAAARFVGEEPCEGLGYAMTTGHMGGDSRRDVAFGAPMSDQEGINSGAVYVFHAPAQQGFDGEYSVTDADAVIRGEGDDTWLGLKVVAGDVDGDGVHDLWVVGGRWQDSAAYLFRGPLEGELTLNDADAVLRAEVEQVDFRWIDSIALTDTDGDGRDDLLVGYKAYRGDGAETCRDEQEICGRVFLFYGPVSGDRALESADAIVFPEAREDWGIGLSAAGLGDINGDGYDEFAVGSTWAEHGGSLSGSVYLFAGRERRPLVED